LSQSARVCPHCGAENPASAIVTICRQCLQSLDEAAEPEVSAVAEETAPAPTIDLPPAPDLSAWVHTEPRAPEAPKVVEREAALPRVGPPPRRAPMVTAAVTLGAPGCGWLFLGSTGLAFAILCVSCDLPKALFGIDTGWQVRMRGSGDPGPVHIFTGLFVLALVIVIRALARGVRAARLLAAGEAAEGTVKTVADTGMRINGRPIYRLTVEFRDTAGQQCEVHAKQGRTQPRTGQPALVFYDPKAPQSGVVLDSLAVPLEVDEAGNIRPANPGEGRRWIVIAVLAVLVPCLAYWLLWTFGPMAW